MSQPPDLLPPHAWCLFLDVDGTLIELTDTPFETRADDDLKSLLGDVSCALEGAVALVSGRSIDYLDALFAPLRMPIAGLHGVERRGAAGTLHAAGDPSQLVAARSALTNLVNAHPGTVLEDKGRTVAIHYRLAPQFEATIHRAVADIALTLGPAYHVQGGNMMLEIKPDGFSKGRAIDAFLEEPPFTGRTPVFAGDDLTDLDGFEAVESRGGTSIGVGDRVTGRCRLADPAAVRAWLRRIASYRAS
jgi:trehalose 6-phosphate phosphatase